MRLAAIAMGIAILHLASPSFGEPGTNTTRAISTGKSWALSKRVRRAPVSNGERVEYQWCGWQTLASDAAGVAWLLVTVKAHARNNDGLAGATLALSLSHYLLGGPVVHLVNRQPKTSAVSLILRASAPVGTAAAFGVAGVLGAATGCHGGGDFCGLGRILTAVGAGFVVGAGGAMVADAVLLARKPIQPRARSENASPALLPMIDAKSRVGVILVGAF